MLDKFEGLIGGLTKKLVVNNAIDIEDVKQELRMKLLCVLPSLSDVSGDEIYSIVKPILRNRLIDIIRSQQCRPDTSYMAAAENIDEMVAEGAGFLSSIILSPDENTSYN